MSLQRYKCRKEVQAFKIASIETDDVNCGHLFDAQGDMVEVSDIYMAKHSPRVGGYYVRYADGYASFSPAQAFEEGYALLDGGSPPVTANCGGLPNNFHNFQYVNLNTYPFINVSHPVPGQAHRLFCANCGEVRTIG